MKTIVGKVACLAAVTAAIAPLASFAQNLASQAGIVDRSLERLTLLTGPDLLSPPHGKPASKSQLSIAPAASKAGEPAVFRFVPAREGYTFVPLGKRSLSSAPSAKAPASVVPRVPLRAPSADELRFDATLRSPVDAPATGVLPTSKRL